VLEPVSRAEAQSAMPSIAHPYSACTADDPPEPPHPRRLNFGLQSPPACDGRDLFVALNLIAGEFRSDPYLKPQGGIASFP
jgi:hypothetical protein